MNETAVNLLMQIPLAGVVVLVVIIFLRFLEKMLTTFMAFIREQREQNNTAITKLADEIKCLAVTINERIDNVETALTQMVERRKRAK